MPRVPAALLIAAAVGESCWDMAGEGLREKDEECSRKGKSEHFLWPKLSNNNRAREGNRPVQTTDRRVIHLMIDENWLQVSDLADYSSHLLLSSAAASLLLLPAHLQSARRTEPTTGQLRSTR